MSSTWQAWSVIWLPQAAKDMRRLDQKTRERVFDAVGRYAQTGVGDVKMLVGGSNEWRLRVCDWRVRFTVELDPRGMHVLHVLARGKAYER